MIWNIEEGLKLDDTANRARRTSARRNRAATRSPSCAITISADARRRSCRRSRSSQRYVEKCNGHRFANYVEWLAIVYAITLAGAAALSLPCGFTRDNLPVGLQIVAPANGEAKLLAGAKLLEWILALDLRPIEPRQPSS